MTEEVGGQVSDTFSRPLDFASAAQVVSAREIHAQVIDALRDM